jgi:hypothetical protein
MARRNQNKQSGAPRKTKSKKRLGKMSQVRLDQQGGARGMGSPMSSGVSLSRRVQTFSPVISRTGLKSMRIHHRELIAAAVAGSTGFTVQNVFSLNPGLAATFPWLAPQAQQWQQYTVHGLRFFWVPIAPTSTAGDVYLVPDYDAADPTPTTETQAADNVDAVVDSCWQDICCVLDPRGMMGIGPRRFVRPCAVAGDVKTFDVGKFFLCTNNESGTSTIGKLFVEYDIEFFEPQNDPNPDTTPQQTSVFSNSAAQTFTTATPAALSNLVVMYDPLSVVAPIAGVFTPPAGCYRIVTNACFRDNANEQFTATMSYWKNGALFLANSQAYTAIQQQAGVAGTEYIELTLDGVVPLNGTDTFQVEVTLTGAAGVLTSAVSDSTVLWSLA